MPLLVLFYLLVGFSGIGLVSLLRLRTILDNVLMALALGAAQLLVTVQLLSLFGMLTPTLLLIVNGLAAGLIGLTARRRLGELVRTCREDSGRLRQLSGEVTKRPVILAFLVLTMLAVGLQSVIGWLMYPMTDVYHFAMPLFWRQNQSILPFPAYDPRLIAVVFGSEAMCLPGYLYANTADMFSVVSGLTAILLVCLVTSMARSLGPPFQLPSALAR